MGSTTNTADQAVTEEASMESTINTADQAVTEEASMGTRANTADQAVTEEASMGSTTKTADQTQHAASAQHVFDIGHMIKDIPDNGSFSKVNANDYFIDTPRNQL